MSNPYNAGPPPNQPHPGGQPYGQQYAPPPLPQEPPRRKNSLVAKIVLALIAAFLGFVVVMAIMEGRSSPQSAGVGDCVSREGSESVKVVECGSADSAFKVVGRVEDQTQVQFSVSSRRICSPFPGAKTAFWQGEPGGEGYVLCLAPAG